MMKKKISWVEVIIILCVVVIIVIGWKFWNKFKVSSKVTQVFVESNMLLISGGSFEMGSNNGSIIEKPVHTVAISSFYLDKYEITNKEYCAFLNSLGNQFEMSVDSREVPWIDVVGQTPSWNDNYCGIVYKQDLDSFAIKSGYEEIPVVYVTWYGAVAYCNWLSEQNGLEKCYGEKGDRGSGDVTKNGYRLPVESEWEYACRAGTTTEYYWGNKMNSEYCWYKDNSYEKLHEVGKKIPNDYGLYDMSGNVWEWCSECTDGANYSGNSGPKRYRICRGGNWDSISEGCRSSTRVVVEPVFMDSYGGFRLARSFIP